MDNHVFLNARARVLADLHAAGVATPAAVSALEDALSQREWWVAQWAEGKPYVAGLVAQDVQDALLDAAVRWPGCPRCDGPLHTLHIEPDLGGPAPTWVCAESGTEVAPLGGLGGPST